MLPKIIPELSKFAFTEMESSVYWAIMFGFNILYVIFERKKMLDAAQRCKTLPIMIVFDLIGAFFLKNTATMIAALLLAGLHSFELCLNAFITKERVCYIPAVPDNVIALFTNPKHCLFFGICYDEDLHEYYGITTDLERVHTETYDMMLNRLKELNCKLYECIVNEKGISVDDISALDFWESRFPSNRSDLEDFCIITFFMQITSTIERSCLVMGDTKIRVQLIGLRNDSFIITVDDFIRRAESLLDEMVESLDDKSTGIVNET